MEAVAVERPRERRSLWGVWEMFVALSLFTAVLVTIQWGLAQFRATTVTATVSLDLPTQDRINGVIEQRLVQLERESQENKADHKAAIFLLITNLLAASGTMIVYIVMQRRTTRHRRT